MSSGQPINETSFLEAGQCNRRRWPAAALKSCTAFGFANADKRDSCAHPNKKNGV